MFLSWARQKPAVLSNHLNQPSLRRLLVYETQSKPGNHHITQSGWRRFVQSCHHSVMFMEVTPGQ